MSTPKEKAKNMLAVIEARKGAIQALLPKYLTPERLFRIAQLAFSKQPLLLDCTPASFVVAMMDAAKAGLEPDGKHAALVPYKGQVQFQPMYQGLVRQAVSLGVARKIEARLVYQNDRFRLWYDPEPHLEHEPALENEGEVIGAYAYAVLPDGSLKIEWMNLRQLEGIRKRAAAKSGPWQTDREEMYRKTPVKRLFKYLPLPESLDYAVQVDNMVESGARREEVPLLEPVPAEPEAKTKGLEERLDKKKSKPEPASEDQLTLLRDLLRSLDKSEAELCEAEGIENLDKVSAEVASIIIANLEAEIQAKEAV